MKIRVRVSGGAAGRFGDDPTITLCARLPAHEHAWWLAKHAGDRAVSGSLMMLMEGRENRVESGCCHGLPRCGLQHDAEGAIRLYHHFNAGWYKVVTSTASEDNRFRGRCALIPTLGRIGVARREVIRALTAG